MKCIMRNAAKKLMVFSSAMLFISVMQPAAAQSAVYKSVDDLGNVAYTDRPAMYDPAIEVEGLTTSMTDKNQIDADKQKADEDAKYQQEANNIRDKQANEDEEFQAAVADQKAAACKAANARLSKYEQARRLYRERPDGEREYLNDNELDTERAEAVRAVDELCG